MEGCAWIQLVWLSVRAVAFPASLERHCVFPCIRNEILQGAEHVRTSLLIVREMSFQCSDSTVAVEIRLGNGSKVEQNPYLDADGGQGDIDAVCLSQAISLLVCLTLVFQGDILKVVCHPKAVGRRGTFFALIASFTSPTGSV